MTQIAIGAGLLAIIVLYICKKVKDHKLLNTVTNCRRGNSTERKLVLKMLKLHFDPSVVFHDLYIRTKNGTYAQIDVVVLSEFGVLVFEVKKLSGWIFGNGFYQYWTQVLAYGKRKHKLYNPIKQNQGHIRALQSRLNLHVPYYSIIVFYGDCKLKKIGDIPEETYLCYPSRVKSILKKLKKRNSKNGDYHYRKETFDVLLEGVLNGADPKIRKAHVDRIRKKYGKSLFWKILRFWK